MRRLADYLIPEYDGKPCGVIGGCTHLGDA